LHSLRGGHSTGDIVLRIPPPGFELRLSVNTLLFASLHIHEGHRGSYRLLVFRFPPSIFVPERWGIWVVLDSISFSLFSLSLRCIDTQSGLEALSILFFFLRPLQCRGPSHSLDRGIFPHLSCSCFAAYRYNAFVGCLFHLQHCLSRNASHF
jgi:hypothetical protein